MINYKETLKYYAKYIKWHLDVSDKYWCKWYQDNLRYYND